MLRKYFDWTPRDIAYWEKIRQKGLRYFILWYGVAITAGLFFILFGLAAFIIWLIKVIGNPISITNVVFLVGQLVFVAVVSLVAGLINSLVTWLVEERLYRKYKARRDSSPLI